MLYIGLFLKAVLNLVRNGGLVLNLVVLMMGEVVYIV